MPKSPRFSADGLLIEKIIRAIMDTAFDVPVNVKLDHLHTLTAMDLNLEAIAHIRTFYAVRDWRRIANCIRALEERL